MKTFNNRQKLDKHIVNDITDFLKFKWDNDKNNFLENEEDHKILQKLSQKKESTVKELYTKFIYVNVLKRFNRFFMIKKENVPSEIGCLSMYSYYEENTYRSLIKEN